MTGWPFLKRSPISWASANLAGATTWTLALCIGVIGRTTAGRGVTVTAHCTDLLSRGIGRTPDRAGRRARARPRRMAYRRGGWAPTGPSS